MVPRFYKICNGQNWPIAASPLSDANRKKRTLSASPSRKGRKPPAALIRVEGRRQI